MDENSITDTLGRIVFAEGQTALKELERMNNTATVRRESIIAWYRWYSRFHRFPDLEPERSDVDLVRTIALWMELTDQGGEPGFPYDYCADFNLAKLNNPSAGTTFAIVGRLLFWVFMLLMVIGVVALFRNWKAAVTLWSVALIANYAGYKVAGGSRNPLLWERDLKRVLDWISKKSPVSTSGGLQREA